MANGGADASQGEGWWQASDGKWYPPQTASPSIPPPPPPQTPSSPLVEDDGGDGSDKPPFWRRRWVLITGGILIVLIIITALTDTSGDDESDTVLELAAAATDEVVCVRVGGTNVGCYRLEGPGTYDLLPDDQIDGEWPNPADVIGVPLVDVTFDYVATSAGDLPRVVFWNLDSSADMARQMIDNLKLAGYIPN